MPLFCERPVGSISYRELRVTISQIPWTSAKTRNNALIPLRGVFDMAAEDEIIDRDPAVKLKNQKHQKPPYRSLFARRG
jgi:integrase